MNEWQRENMKRNKRREKKRGVHEETVQVFYDDAGDVMRWRKGAVREESAKYEFDERKMRRAYEEARV